jgi:hypothetical protein
MKYSSVPVRLPAYDVETIAPVTILDSEGHVVRVVPAAVFHPPALAPVRHRHEQRRGVRRPSSAPAAENS